MRKRKLRLVIAGLIVLTGLILIPRWWARPDWNMASGIPSGMTRAKVEALIGCPPGDYGTHEPHPMFPPGSEIWSTQPEVHYELDGRRYTTLRWTDDDHGFVVDVDDASGRVVYAVDAPVTWEPKAGPFDAFLWRAKRQWRKWFPE